MSLTTEDRSVGCLLAAACGDALGKSSEFMSRTQVRERFGVLADFQGKKNLPAGYWTDDTNLMLALAESICDTGKVDPAAIAESSVKWWQMPPQRGYGENTLLALQKLKRGESWEATAGDMPSNGAAMKIAPVGIVSKSSRLPDLVKDASAWSHKNQVAISAAVCMAAGIQRLMSGEVTPSFHPDVTRKMAEAVTAIDDDEVLRILVTPNKFGSNFAIDGWQALFLANYCYARYPSNPEKAIIYAVNLGGDADTIGCMVGAMCGARHGRKWIPDRWLDHLESLATIEDLGKRLATIEIR